ncbi:GAF and ANTAR domain-containing protein [Streptomyces sp. enrichment culture]|uniref:GAF and ANTAR domain-containing protein n=1 Tax=Streptomyces sp. enrichment culture TaxID=1795815 RepID=UPI003F572376
MGHKDERDPTRTAEPPGEDLRCAGPDELMGHLCELAVGLLPVSCAGVLLCGDGMPMPLAASCERAGRVMDLQTGLGEGPSLLAAETGAPVVAADLRDGPDAARWPVFAPLVAATGVRALYAMPLGCEPCCVGTLDLYRDTPGALGARDLRAARLLAEVVTVALTTLRPGEEDEDLADPRSSWLGERAAGQDSVYQAVGMIMARLRIAADEALARLRAYAFARGRSVPEAARDIVARRVRFEPDLAL